jgi:hypothetical protein
VGSGKGEVVGQPSGEAQTKRQGNIADSTPI